ncbi:MAG: PEP-CTERM sorting domain-containing protein [Pseudomonadota bacterium]|nr:PEP-CTERM sorting domain-containing protein [Pseudomonadota bacterium]
MIRAAPRTARPPAAATFGLPALKGAALLCCLLAGNAMAASILFVGNSFTYGAGTPVMMYRAHTVTDLNGEAKGGVPALFKAFTVQAGLDYDVATETHPGVGIDWHLAHSLDAIGKRRWDTVVLQSYSTLDATLPGDAALLIDSVGRMSAFLKRANPAVTLRLTATWSRADQTYAPGGHWHGKPIEAMANDLRAAYDQAAAGAHLVNAVIPVGEAWTRAMRSGFADDNPYDGIDAGKVNLWGGDHYHASIHGYYLEALTIFGSVTGRDPRSLGMHECAGLELGITAQQIGALEQIAADQLTASGSALAPLAAVAAVAAARPAAPGGCAVAR